MIIHIFGHICRRLIGQLSLSLAPDFRVTSLPASSTIAVALVGLSLLSHVAEARINVVSLPERSQVQLTIYNSADLTLVRETRSVTLRKGLNRMEFSWANTRIDPTSLELRMLTHADEVDVLDASFPPRVTNLLEWRLQSEYAGEAQIEVRYFTSGISWSADYLAEASTDEKQLNLAGFVRIKNHSGEDYENAQVRLVVGVIRLVENIAALAAAGRPESRDKYESKTALLGVETVGRRLQVTELSSALGKAETAAKKKEIVKEELSEYFLYTVEGTDTIPDGWEKRLPSFNAPAIPLKSYYKFERERWQSNVMRYYRFKNSKEDQLGKEPLPDGLVNAYRLVNTDRNYGYVGRASAKYLPINEQAELELGYDQDVMVRPVLLNWEKTDLRLDADGNVKGWTVHETWEIEARNSKDIDIELDIRRNFPEDWTVKTESNYEKVDAHKIKFLRPLKAHQNDRIVYELTTRHGLNRAR